MRVKQFLVQFEFERDTRWITDDLALTNTIRHLLGTICEVQTEGHLPRVLVMAIDRPERLEPGKIAVLQTKSSGDDTGERYPVS